jgi:hypothetical protein
MMSPPKKLAAAARLPSSRLVVRGDIKDCRLPMVDWRLLSLRIEFCEVGRGPSTIFSDVIQFSFGNRKSEFENRLIRCGGN